MTIEAVSGPIVTFRDGVVGANAGTNVNPDTGPSVFDQGNMLLDPRAAYTYLPGNAAGSPCRGFLNSDYITIDQTPAAATNTNIAAAQAPGTATTLTLSTTSTTGITPGVTITRGDTGATVTGLTALDTTQSPVLFGQTGSVQAWDPTKSVSRNISIVAVGGNNSGVTFTVSGYDLYNFPMTENIAGSTSGVAIAGAKGFKYVASISYTGTVGSGVSVGTGTLVGLPLRADSAGHVSIFGNTANTWLTAASGVVTTAVTSTATATTGDVRGTIAYAGAGSSRLVVYQTVTVSNISTTTGLFGVTQG